MDNKRLVIKHAEIPRTNVSFKRIAYYVSVFILILAPICIVLSINRADEFLFQYMLITILIMLEAGYFASVLKEFKIVAIFQTEENDSLTIRKNKGKKNLYLANYNKDELSFFSARETDEYKKNIQISDEEKFYDIEIKFNDGLYEKILTASYTDKEKIKSFILNNFSTNFYDIGAMLKEIEEYTDSRKYGLALECCNNLININPDESEAYYKKANIEFLQEKFENAIADNKKAIELNYKHIALVYCNLGMIYKKLNDFKNAEDAFDDAMRYADNVFTKNYIQEVRE